MAFDVTGVFCEDIRIEKSNQFTLVGILPDTISLPERPSGLPDSARERMPKLALYIRIHMSPNERVGPMTVKLMLPGDVELPLGEIDADIISRSKAEAVASGVPIAGIVHHVVLQGFAIPPPPSMITGVLWVGKKQHTFANLRFTYEPATAIAT